MVSNVILEHLGHESVHRAPRAGDETQHLTALGFPLQRPRDGFDLPANAGNPQGELPLISDDV
jgi:hypothetical protein